MDQPTALSIASILFSLAGFYLAYLYGKKTKRFHLSEYLALVAVPVGCIVFLGYILDEKIFTLFVISALLGLVLEYAIGLLYHKTLNQRLWTYNRFALHGYTSLLSLPMWGIAGVVFWAVGDLIGL